MIAPEAACRNLQALAAEDVAGKFGFYEAVDYTPSRLRRGETRALVRSFMAHHQGMSLLSLAYLLLDRPMQRRFESEPFQATLVLQDVFPMLPFRTSSPSPTCVARNVREQCGFLSSAKLPFRSTASVKGPSRHGNHAARKQRWKDLALPAGGAALELWGSLLSTYVDSEAFGRIHTSLLETHLLGFFRSRSTFGYSTCFVEH